MRCLPWHRTNRFLTEAQIAELQPQVPEWQVKEINGMQRLERAFKRYKGLVIRHTEEKYKQIRPPVNNILACDFPITDSI